MSKIELNTSIADYGFSQINANFQLIEDELNQKVLYRDNPVGEPNTIESLIDLNDNDIINVNDLRVDNEIFLRGVTLDEAIDAAAGGLVGDAQQAATDAAASAAVSLGHANNSAASAASAAASYDSFDDRYLGPKSVPPTVDNDGNPLLTGALYWDTTLSPGGTFPATDITVTPVGNIGSTTVQAALQELDNEKAKTNGDVSVPFSSSAFTGPLTGNVTGNLTGNSTGAHNGTVGATTPNTGSFTTLAASGGITGTLDTASQPNITSVGTLTSLTVSGTITPSQTNGIVGTTTNNNANAGSVGEFASNSTTGTSLPSNTNTNATSISLTAGDWDVDGVIGIVPAGSTTLANIQAGISTTSATMPTAIGERTIFGPAGAAGVGSNVPTPTTRISLSATTTIYLVAFAGVNISTATVDGFIRARRVR